MPSAYEDLPMLCPKIQVTQSHLQSIVQSTSSTIRSVFSREVVRFSILHLIFSFCVNHFSLVCTEFHIIDFKVLWQFIKITLNSNLSVKMLVTLPNANYLYIHIIGTYSFASSKSLTRTIHYMQSISSQYIGYLVTVSFIPSFTVLLSAFHIFLVSTDK